jgi:hypothetical protein
MSNLFGAEELPERLEMLLVQIFNISGPIDVDRSKIGSVSWLKIGSADWEDNLPVNKQIQKVLEYIIRLLWYIHARNKFFTSRESAEHVEWILRLIPFTEIHSKSELVNISLNSLLLAGDEKQATYLAELVGLYFHEIPYELNQKLAAWKASMSAKNPTLLQYIT